MQIFTKCLINPQTILPNLVTLLAAQKRFLRLPKWCIGKTFLKFNSNFAYNLHNCDVILYVRQNWKKVKKVNYSIRLIHQTISELVKQLGRLNYISLRSSNFKTIPHTDLCFKNCNFCFFFQSIKIYIYEGKQLANLGNIKVRWEAKNKQTRFAKINKHYT